MNGSQGGRLRGNRSRVAWQNFGGNFKSENTALSLCAVHFNMAAHGFHKLAGYGHAKAGALEGCVGFGAAILDKGVKYLLQECLAHAPACVRAAVNGSHMNGIGQFLTDVNLDGAACWREFYGIADNIEQNLL